MVTEIITLDIETENTGFDIMGDNKRMISLQLLDDDIGRIFFDGTNSNNLDSAKKELCSLIDSGKNFLGFNVRNFDVHFIKEFLGIEIPSSQIIDIGEMPEMEKIRQRLGKKKPRLEEVCNLLGIDCTHKMTMNQRSQKFKGLPEVIQKAKEGSTKWQKELGWSGDFSYTLALDRISGGMAIMEAFEEFLKSRGDQNSFFYQYAMGDVHAERELYLKLKN
jgi:hypothetical protein